MNGTLVTRVFNEPVSWRPVETWTVLAVVAGTLTTEVRTNCTVGSCAWRVQSPEVPIAVSALRLFSDRGCTEELVGRAIASEAGDCSPIDVVDVGGPDVWCGSSGAWVGRATAAFPGVMCARVRGVQPDEPLALAELQGFLWHPVAVWQASVGDEGEEEAEVQLSCRYCTWRISSASAWSAIEIRMFTDPGCSGEVFGHAVASRSDCGGCTDCGGAPALADGDRTLTGGRWCGQDVDWAGLTIATPVNVNCAIISGDAGGLTSGDVKSIRSITY